MPIPSDHAPLLIDLDEPGVPVDAGWEGAETRFRARQAADQRTETRKATKAGG